MDNGWWPKVDFSILHACSIILLLICRYTSHAFNNAFQNLKTQRENISLMRYLEIRHIS